MQRSLTQNAIDFCHFFHGIQPRQNTKEKKHVRQVAKEMTQRKRVAAGTRESNVVSNFQAVKQKPDTPFMVISGAGTNSGY